MDTSSRLVQALLLCASTLTVAAIADAACPGATVADGGHCLYGAGFSSVAGDGASAAYGLLATRMDPYQYEASGAELARWNAAAVADLQAGKTFREGLLLVDAQPGDGSARGEMLAHPELDYAAVGLLDGLAEAEQGLREARDTFAYLLYRDWPDAEANLLDSIKTLANLYLMLGDESLIDALEWRVPAGTVGAEPMLDKQLAQLDDAVNWYDKAIEVFIHGFSPTVGTNLYVSEHFDDAVFGLFALAVERTALALRERASRQLVRQMAPDAGQTAAARATALATLKSANVSTYLALAAIAATDAGLDTVGADSSLVDALAMLRKQGNIQNLGLNPLGYDERYVPMLSYGDLYALAHAGLGAAYTAKSGLDAETRAFDANQEQLRAGIDAISRTYEDGLAALTGCQAPADRTDPDAVAAFIICTGEAGGDLYACATDLGPDAFDTCVDAAATAGVLARKYRDIAAARLRVAAARTRRDNILAQIELEDERTGRVIALWRDNQADQVALHEEYLPKLQAACSITETTSDGKVREWDLANKRWQQWAKKKDSNTVRRCTIHDDKLDLDTQHAIDLLAATTEFNIANVNLDTEYRVKNLLLAQAEAELEIDLAVAQFNSAIADFDDAFAQKEGQWSAYQRARDQLGYYTERTATLRILRSQAAITLSERMNYVTHYAYLAAKAAEYQYLTPLGEIDVPTGVLRLTDLYKAQTPGDLDAFLLDLNGFVTGRCPWGTFDPEYQQVSVAVHLLGLTDGYLDPDGNGQAANGKSIATARREAFQAFIAEHLDPATNRLRFSFTISEGSSFFAASGKFNVKLWSGPAPSGCGPLVDPVKGTTVNLLSTQVTQARPRVRLRQIGHSSLRDSFGDIVDYIPVGDMHFFLTGSGDYLPIKEAEFNAYFEAADPRAGGNGAWTGNFKGRSLSSSNWEIELFDSDPLYPRTDWSRLTDIRLYFDTIGECCWN